MNAVSIIVSLVSIALFCMSVSTPKGSGVA